MDNPSHDRPRLLLADDDRTFCQVLARAFDARGFAVDVVHDGRTAVQLINRTVPDYAVIDLRLPDVSGLKLVEHLKHLAEHVPVVVLTGYGSIATAIEAIKLGATHYLTKPSDADQIVAAFAHRKANPDVPAAERPLSVDRVEWEHIQRVLAGFDGNVSATARALDMHRRSLQRKLNKHPPRE
ncbi:MAG TPA: response regulator transcription factor [Burkholderiales bacterium]|nr:response regulator transcription factor [Burkholderiales bacterium]